MSIFTNWSRFKEYPYLQMDLDLKDNGSRFMGYPYFQMDLDLGISIFPNGSRFYGFP